MMAPNPGRGREKAHFCYVPTSKTGLMATRVLRSGYLDQNGLFGHSHVAVSVVLSAGIAEKRPVR